MAKREITDWRGKITGERIARYVWRSKPTRSPLTDRPIRCIVAQDEKGQYWAATRTGRGDGQNAEYEMWESCASKQEAMVISRQIALGVLACQAEMYSDGVNDKRVAINAPGRHSPAEARVMKLFNRVGSNKKPPEKPQSRGRSVERWGATYSCSYAVERREEAVTEPSCLIDR